MKINKLSEIASNYDAYLVDLWGVLHNGQQAFPEAVLALAELKALQKKIILLSNSPRRVRSSESRLVELGIVRDFYDELYTSGEDCFQALQYSEDEWYRKLGRSYFHIGPQGNKCMAHELLKIPTDNIEEADFILVTGTNGWEADVSAYVPALEKAYEMRLSMVCANPDLTVLFGEETVICAGAIAQYYEGIGGEVRYHGKPYPGIYQVIMRKLFPIRKARILAIGDSLRTDIKGAAQLDIDTMLVLSGVHRKLQDQSCEVICDYGREYFQVEPRYIIDKLQF